MKPGQQPELLLQIGKSKILAKGPDAINAVKWPLRFLIVTMGLAVLGLVYAGSAYGMPAVLLLAKLF
jgi:hypothetical protein